MDRFLLEHYKILIYDEENISIVEVILNNELNVRQYYFLIQNRLFLSYCYQG